jgi:hypothetical protein
LPHPFFLPRTLIDDGAAAERPRTGNACFSRISFSRSRTGRHSAEGSALRMRQDRVSKAFEDQTELPAASSYFSATTFWGGLLLSGFMLAAAVILAS